MCEGCCIVSRKAWDDIPQSKREQMMKALPRNAFTLHEPMCIVYLLCMQIVNLVSNRASPGTTECRAWRLDGLILMYVGYLIYIAGKQEMTFHNWFMYLFHPLRSFQRQGNYDARCASVHPIGLCI